MLNQVIHNQAILNHVFQNQAIQINAMPNQDSFPLINIDRNLQFVKPISDESNLSNEETVNGTKLLFFIFLISIEIYNSNPTFTCGEIKYAEINSSRQVPNFKPNYNPNVNILKNRGYNTLH